MFLLVQVRHGDPPLGLLHHVGLVPQVDVDDGRCQLAGLPVHLHGDGLAGGEGHFFTLMETLAVTAHLQRGLHTNSTESGSCDLNPDHETLKAQVCVCVRLRARFILCHVI